MSETIKDNIIETKHYWTILALEACGHVPEAINPIKTKDGNTTLLYYTFGEAALEDYEAWMRGETQDPFGVIRKIQQSATQFKNNLYRYCR